MNSYTWDFLTLLPECNNIDIYKDVGMIPYTLAKEYGLHTAVASSNMDDNAGDQLDMTSVPMDILHLKQKNRFVAGGFFLLKNAGRIKVLNLYHAGKVVNFWIRLYKLLNPQGTVYLKLDTSEYYFTRLEGKGRKEFIKSVKLADKISAESALVQNLISKSSEKEIFYLPNGYYGSKGNPEGYDKQNVFLTVGRIGAYEKNTEVLLKAFSRCREKQEWTLELVGPVNEDFNSYIDDYFNKYPEQKDRVILKGAIFDKEKLLQEYEKAKVFILPSRWESFGIAAVEALSRGCRLILSDTVSPAYEFTDGNKYGRTFNAGDEEDLSKAMLESINEDHSPKMQGEIMRYAQKTFGWNNICERLVKYL